MKRAITVGLILVLTALVLTSCGGGWVTKEDYNKVYNDFLTGQTQAQNLQKDLTTAQSETQSLRGELTTSKTTVQSLRNELYDTQTNFQSLQSDLTAKDAELEATERRLKEAKARVELLNAILIPAFKGELDRMTDLQALDYFLKFRDKVKETGDPVLTQRFEAMINTYSDEATNLEATLSFYIYLLESIENALSQASYGQV